MKDRIKAALVRDGRKRGQGLLQVVQHHYANENSMHQFLSKIWGENVQFIKIIFVYILYLKTLLTIYTQQDTSLQKVYFVGIPKVYLGNTLLTLR